MTNGRAIGSLRPLRRIGAGGMGEVWLCRDDALGVDRAVKLLLPERAGDAALRARFAAEARTLAALGGVPGIVRVHAAGEDPATRRPFFVMDAHLLAPEEVRAVCTRRLGLPAAAAEAIVRAAFAAFESHAESAENAEFPFTLQDALGDEAAGTARQLPERAVLSLAREIAAALARLHGRAPPVVHRDLKPANLLFAADGRLLLADFGVARTLDPARTGLTRTGAQPGTQRYAAPELLRGDPATPAADWYSLGVVLFRALTSSFPQWGEAFPTREGLRPFSPRWEPLLRDLLAPDPARRLADRAELSRRLDALEEALDRPRGGRRRAKAVAALAAAVLAAGSLLVFRAAPGPGETRNPAPEAKSEIRLPNPVEPHAESAAVESHAEFAESAEHPVAEGGSVEAQPLPVAAPRPAEPASGVPRATAARSNSASLSDSVTMSGVYSGAAFPARPARRAETSRSTPHPQNSPSQPPSASAAAPSGSSESRGYSRADVPLTPQETLVAEAVKNDDLHEFLPSMRRQLKALLPIENPLDVGGLPPGYDTARKMQTQFYGERIVKDYQKNVSELYARHLSGETIAHADVQSLGLSWDEWAAWVLRKDREREAADRKNSLVPMESGAKDPLP